MPPQSSQIDPASIQHSVSVYRRIATVFVLFSLLLVGFVLYIVFTQATVVVLSEQESITTDFIIDVARNPGTGEVKGDVLEAVETLEREFPASDGTIVKDNATGVVRITSSLSRVQPLIATTRLITPDEQLYRISENVTVPAFGSVEVAAYADTVGAEGDLADSTFVIPGLNPSTQSFFEVEIVEPFTGGERTLQAITQEDIDMATDVLTQELHATLKDRLHDLAVAQELPTSGTATTFETLAAVTSASAGTQTAAFTLNMEVRAVGVFYEAQQFGAQVKTRIGDLIPFDKTLVAVDDAQEHMVEKYDLATGRANMRVHADGTAILSPEAPSLDPGKLSGVSVEAAVNYLESLDGVSSASVTMRPFWAKRMPNILDRITVEVR